MLARIHYSKVITIICLASLLNLSSASFPGLVRAQSSNNTENDTEQLEGPDRRIGGGGRPAESCLFNKNQQPLTAIIPKNYLGITAVASPTLFFYVPQIEQPQEVEVEFVLRDPNDKLVYETTFTLTGNAGIISLVLPDSKELNLLKINQDYHWYFSTICNPQDRSKDIVVEGLIRRVKLDPVLADKLAQATQIERVRLYLEANLWHDALTALAELKRSRPKDPAVLNMWTQILRSADLNEAIAQEPLIDSYLRLGTNEPIMTSL